MRNFYKVLAVGLAFGWLCASVTQGATLRPLNIAQIAQLAEMSFIGKVISVEVRHDDQGIPATFYTFKIEQPLFGSPGKDNMITIKQFGFAWADPVTGEANTFASIPVYQEGKDYLFFWTGESPSGFRSPVGLGQGAFLLLPDGQVVNEYDNIGLAKDLQSSLVRKFTATQRSYLEKQAPIPLVDFLGIMEKVLDRPLPKELNLDTSNSSQPTHTRPQAGPLFTQNAGAPIVWDLPTTAHAHGGQLSAIPYNSDQGGGGSVLGTLSKASADALTAAAFGAWDAVTTSAITYINAGDTSVDITSSNVSTFLSGTDGINPIIYDRDGSITDFLFGFLAKCSILGFSGLSSFIVDSSGQTHIREAVVAMNGFWINGSSDSGTCGFTAEISVTEFQGVFTHEFGHFHGQDHSQVNGRAYQLGKTYPFPGFAGPPPLSEVETMYPFIIGHDPSTLEFDDITGVSRLYPNSSFDGMGRIKGSVFNTDGATPVNCVNVIVRKLDDPFNTATSWVTGYGFYNFLGVNVPSMYGLYEVQGLPDGTYTVEVETIHPSALSGSSIGPDPGCEPQGGFVALPGPAEFYNGASESSSSATDSPSAFTGVSVTAGNTVNSINIIFNGLFCQEDENFETGNFTKFPWSTGGNATWSVISDAQHGGTYLAKAGTILDSQSSFLEVTLTVTGGSICFWRQVSSESFFDFLRFKIDGVQQASWSGETNFSAVSFPVTAGTHTFRWEYTKDSSLSRGQDTVWVDNIDFPGVAPQDTAANFSIERSTGYVKSDGSFNSGTAGGPGASTPAFNAGIGADLAERINVSERVEPGHVVEPDPNQPKLYRKARMHSSGVISSRPGMTLNNAPYRMQLVRSPQETPALSIVSLNDRGKLSLALGVSLQTLIRVGTALNESLSVSQLLDQLELRLDSDAEDNRPLLALIGRVPVKATTENGPIHPGDLLVVSASHPGYAMRCADAKSCEGAEVGKALEVLESGEGLILVLVTGR